MNLLPVLLLCGCVASGLASVPLYGMEIQRNNPEEFLVVVDDLSQFKAQFPRVIQEYQIGSWKAVLVLATEAELEKIQTTNGVKFIETNHHVKLIEKPSKEEPLRQDPYTKPEKTTDDGHNMDEYVITVHDIEKFKQNEKSSCTILREIRVHSMQALLVRMTPDQYKSIQSHPDVVSVEENKVLKMSRTTDAGCVKQETDIGHWGLARLSSNELRPDLTTGQYEYSVFNKGEGATVYVVDSGVYVDHEDFGDRARWGFTADGVQHEGDFDSNGHGTFVASLAAGRVHGVAKGANIVAVKVMDADGIGNLADIAQGLQWTVMDIVTRGTQSRSVVNLSLGNRGDVFFMDSIIQAGTEQGIVFTISAGNDMADACEYIPARVSGAITVGATDIYGQLAWYSNFGPCVDILAPGSDIEGASPASPQSSTVESGTSMSAPFVAGTVARLLSSLDSDVALTPLQVKSFIVDTALQNHVAFGYIFHFSTPSRLLHMDCSFDASNMPSLAQKNLSADCVYDPLHGDNWHLNRISSRNYDVNYNKGGYVYTEGDAGEGVDVYVIDTGIFLEHEEFEGRASWGMTASGINEQDTDTAGHGTHVASLAVGKTHGVAKKANVIAVKVMGADGFGDVLSLLEGIEWVANHIDAKKATNGRRKNVINMSVSFPSVSYGIEAALNEIIRRGTPVVVAAGNWYSEACFSSPSRVASAITVAASTKDNFLAVFSSYGSCVDIVAPGVDIKGAGIQTPSSYQVFSGTSQASPLVAGAVARYLSTFDESEPLPSPAEIEAALVDTSTHGVVKHIRMETLATPNALLYASCESFTQMSNSANKVISSSIFIVLLMSVLFK